MSRVELLGEFGEGKIIYIVSKILATNPCQSPAADNIAGTNKVSFLGRLTDVNFFNSVNPDDKTC